MTKTLFRIIAVSFTLLCSTQSDAENISIAVASNFAQTLHMLANDFKANTGHQLRISSASTGKLYTQISHGAPFDIFLAADEVRPDRLIAEDKASAEQARVYAQGKLTFISNIKPEKNCQTVLNSAALKRLAIANPKTAPYGAAAQQTLEKLQHWQSLKPKLVMGENIAQTLQFVATGSANAGFVAKSMLQNNSNINVACEWDVAADMHTAINQKMVILKKSSGKLGVKAFWHYLQSEGAKTIIKNSGYDVP